MRNTRWTPAISSRHLSKFADDVFGKGISDFIGQDFSWTQPSVNVKETDESYEIELASPGLKKEDFDIKVEKDHLVISAQTSTSKEEGDEAGKYNRREFNYSSFKRSFYLPELVSAEDISASYENGVLQLSLPKNKEVAQDSIKKIEIS